MSFSVQPRDTQVTSEPRPLPGRTGVSKALYSSFCFSPTYPVTALFSQVTSGGGTFVFTEDAEERAGWREGREQK